MTCGKEVEKRLPEIFHNHKAAAPKDVGLSGNPICHSEQQSERGRQGWHHLYFRVKHESGLSNRIYALAPRFWGQGCGAAMAAVAAHCLVARQLRPLVLVLPCPLNVEIESGS
jgi:hypothetical protein